jgi:tetratricopeptide (TPR) repeat protein
MKIFFTLFIIVMSINTFAQSTYEAWETEAETNIRLRPQYGNIAKTKEQKETDQTFIDETMKIKKFNGNKRAASNEMIAIGFKYLYNGDLKTAMYRFNQAYLLDSQNTDIYWGYGAIYMSLLNYEKAKEQYLEGLKHDPKNTHLLTDYATYFLAKYYEQQNSENKNAKDYLDKAIKNLTASYAIDAKDQNTLYKLSIAYYLNGNCIEAKQFFHLCKQEGGKPIDAAFTEELTAICP